MDAKTKKRVFLVFTGHGISGELYSVHFDKRNALVVADSLYGSYVEPRLVTKRGYEDLIDESISDEQWNLF